MLANTAHKIMMVCLAAASLLALYLLLAGPVKNPRLPFAAAPATDNCSYADKSFCATENSIRQYVATNDFSDVLEDQTPVTVTCDGTPAEDQHCQSVKAGLTMQLFQIKLPAGTQLVTRNQYIAYFASYIQQYGTLSYGATTAEGNDIVMDFQNRASTHAYSLLFQRQGSSWKVLYPTIGVLQ